MTEKKDLGFWKLWNLSFGFFGVQIAYALQSSQVSRIFSTIGADPHDLSYFWILPPLMGLIVQPIVGSASDNTWTRLGRRLPYLLFGALVAVIVMCLLPNAGSFHFTVSTAIIFGLVMLMFLDTSINMAMQPFKMLVGDFVNERQKGLAYSIQSFLCNAGSVVGYIAPIVLALFLANTAPEGEVPQTVTWSFYLGAIILALCVVYTFAKVKEMPPAEYAAYHGISPKPQGKKEKENMFRLLVKAPKVFWTVGLVQFFCWAAFLFMWTYSTDAIANHVFEAPSTQRVTGVTVDGKSYSDKYLFNGTSPLILDGKLVAASDAEGNEVTALSLVEPGATLTLAHIAKEDRNTGEYVLEQTSDVPTQTTSEITVDTATVLNSASKQYQDAGDWNGVLLAIQAIAAVLWAIVLPRFRNRRLGYSLSLLIGAIGFISVYFISNRYAIGVSYALMGCAWSAMLAMPFTILTNALSGNHIGTYLGLFNCTITIPQIIAALCGGLLLGTFPLSANGAPDTVWMLVSSGVLLVLGSVAVWNVRETYGEKEESPAAETIASTEM